MGLVLSVVSLAVMPALAYAKQRTGREMGSEALQADAVETWVCSYLSLALLVGVGPNTAFGWWWARPRGSPGHAAGDPLAGLADVGGSPRGGRGVMRKAQRP